MLRTATDVATIYVIEAKSDAREDIITALKTAASLGVDVVTMSFGSTEFMTEGEGAGALFNSVGGVTWIPASGDNFYPSFPATHPGVVAVGASSLSSLIPRVETTWSESGCGESIYVPNLISKRRWCQHHDQTFRARHFVQREPELRRRSLLLALGRLARSGGYLRERAIFAGIVCLANGSRRHANKPMLSSGTGIAGTQPSQLQTYLYQLLSNRSDSAALHDIVSGSGCGTSAAGQGYDLPSGVGSVDAQKLIDYLTTAP